MRHLPSGSEAGRTVRGKVNILAAFLDKVPSDVESDISDKDPVVPLLLLLIGWYQTEVVAQTGCQDSNPYRIAKTRKSLVWRLWLVLHKILEEVWKPAGARAVLVCSESRDHTFLPLGHPFAVSVGSGFLQALGPVTANYAIDHNSTPSSPGKRLSARPSGVCSLKVSKSKGRYMSLRPSTLLAK
jgi:hypothetical protein